MIPGFAAVPPAPSGEVALQQRLAGLVELTMCRGGNMDLMGDLLGFTGDLLVISWDFHGINE